MQNKPKVLFVSHDATRTGAPIIFLNLIAWLLGNGHVHGHVLLRNGGEIASQFAALCPTFQVAPYRSRRERIARFLRRRQADDTPSVPEISLKRLARYVGKEVRPDLIYVNTVTNASLMESLAQLGVPIITHVHELEFLIRHRIGAEQFAIVNKYTDTYITVSDAVSRNLANNWQVDPARIHMVYGFVPEDVIHAAQVDRSAIQEQIRRELGIAPGDFVVGGSGILGWTKGPEHIIQLALYLKQRAHRPVHVIWVGGHAGALRVAELQHDIDKTGLTATVHLVGSKPNPLDYFSIFDIFALVSREDSFPLVNLEVTMLDVPIICFKNAGGTSEFVANGQGIEVPYLDINEMANQLVRLMRNPRELSQLTARARERLLQEHTIDAQGTKIAQIVRDRIHLTAPTPQTGLATRNAHIIAH